MIVAMRWLLLVAEWVGDRFLLVRLHQVHLLHVQLLLERRLLLVLLQLQVLHLLLEVILLRP